MSATSTVRGITARAKYGCERHVSGIPEEISLIARCIFYFHPRRMDIHCLKSMWNTGPSWLLVVGLSSLGDPSVVQQIRGRNTRRLRFKTALKTLQQPDTASFILRRCHPDRQIRAYPLSWSTSVASSKMPTFGSESRFLQTILPGDWPSRDPG